MGNRMIPNMKFVLVLISVVFISFTSCARKSIPGRIDTLKDERAQALKSMEAARAVVEANTTKPKKHPHKRRHTQGHSAAENVSAEPDLSTISTSIVRDDTKYLDVNFANKVYHKLIDAYVDSIRLLPDENIKDVHYVADFVGTTNFNLRKPQYVIIHHTSQDSVTQTLRTFTLQRTQVSAHYVIDRDGTVHHMLNDYLRAWQAGKGKWNNITDMNSCSIGIELDNDGYVPFSKKQINSLLKVLAGLKSRFHIPAANFIGHGDYAPIRKNDPNVHFPWELLAGKGFGLWWSDTTGVHVPEDFNEYLALRIVGYNVKEDIGKSIIAFRRHFCGVESKEKVLSPAERKVLYMLYTKYM